MLPKSGLSEEKSLKRNNLSPKPLLKKRSGFFCGRNMKVERENRYLYLREDIHPPVYQRGISSSRHRKEVYAWYQGLDPEQRILHALLQAQVFGLLGVTSNHELQAMIEHPELKQVASDRFLEQTGLIYGLKGSERIKQKCKEYGDCANAVRDNLQHTLSYEGSPNLEMTNEIRPINEPAELLLIALDGAWPAKARWDAKLKLQFMALGANIDRRERELGIENQFKRFVMWMHESIWSRPEFSAGDSKGSYLVSTHDPETWACIEAHWVAEKDGVDLKLEPFQKKTHLVRRSIKAKDGRIIETYITTREKTLPVKVEKMLRKGAEDPAIAVDDDTGLLAVFNNIDDAIKFITLLIEQGYKSNYPISIEDVSYTLNGKEYNGCNGSSHKTRMMKFFVRLANEMRIEFIIHTPETYAESLYMKGVSRYEYNINRLIDNGVPGLILDKKYFPLLDSEETRTKKINQVRRKIEEEN